MAIVICHLANLSFTAGRFPTSMKTGWITPLLKKTGLAFVSINMRMTRISTPNCLITQHRRLHQMGSGDFRDVPAVSKAGSGQLGYC